MIRFIDLSDADLGQACFAFFDTVPDLFVECDDTQTFASWTEFEEAWRAEVAHVKHPLERFRVLCPEWVFWPTAEQKRNRVIPGGLLFTAQLAGNASKPNAIELSPPIDGFECGRCWQLHALLEQRGEAIPEHSPRCPMCEERARAWHAGVSAAINNLRNGGTSPLVNPHAELTNGFEPTCTHCFTPNPCVCGKFFKA